MTHAQLWESVREIIKRTSENSRLKKSTGNPSENTTIMSTDKANNSEPSAPPLPRRKIGGIPRYEEIYITLTGSIRVHGEGEATLEEAYLLTKAEALELNLKACEKDVLDTLFWFAKNNPKEAIHHHGECSRFFGPNAHVTEIIPRRQLFIMSRRPGFPNEWEQVDIKASGQWTMRDKDWMIEISLEGQTKILDDTDLKKMGKDLKNLYLKNDKESPFNMNEG